MVEGRGGTDHATLLRWAWRDPEGFGALIDLLVDATTRHLLAQIGAGVEVVQLFESWASAAPASLFQRWCVAPVAEIVSRIRTVAPGVPILGFPRGAGSAVRSYATATGVNAVGIDQATAMVTARASVPAGVALQGNLDPIVLAEGGASLNTEIDNILDAMAGAPHVFNLGHGIRQDTPPEHVAQLVERVRRRRS
jgi:uroporphyrinogen decarboxylase